MVGLQNKLRTLGFVQSMAGDWRSLDRVVFDASVIGTGMIPPGAVLGQITASGTYRLSPKSGSDGSQIAVCILSDWFDTNFDPTANMGGVAWVVARKAEVRLADLTFDPSVVTIHDKMVKVAQLAALDIIARFEGGVPVFGAFQ